jgi:hypothetical protein
MKKHRTLFLVHWREVCRRLKQKQGIEAQRLKANEGKIRKEAVRTIEKFWAYVLLRRDLIAKRKMYEKLPKDCRRLWVRFS